MAMKLHFESDTYDAVKYNYKTSAKPQSFFKRRDKYHFAKLGRKFDTPKELIQFFVAQFTKGDTTWVGNMLNDEEQFTDWSKKVQALTYTFENDINTLTEKVDSFDQLFEITSDSPYPLVVNAYLQGDITLETVVILNQMTGFMKQADKNVNDTIVWPDVSRRIRKYGTFLSFNTEKVRNIILRMFTS
jgi:hypothetical protein